MKIKKVLNKRNKIVKPLKNRNNVKKMNIIVNKKSVVKKRRLKDREMRLNEFMMKLIKH